MWSSRKGGMVGPLEMSARVLMSYLDGGSSRWCCGSVEKRVARELGDGLAGIVLIMGHSYFVVERKHLSVNFAAPSQDPGTSCIPPLSS